MDAITGALERVPGPTWLAYIGVTLASTAWVLVESSLSRVGLAAMEANPSAIGYVFLFVFPLAAYQYMSLGARSTWDAFRPATSMTDEAAADARLQLSTTPFIPVAVVWLAAAAMNALYSVLLPETNDLANQPPINFVMRIVSESLWVAPTSILLVYLVIRQVRLVSRLHRDVEHVDLLQPGPLHAMSRLTSRGAIVLIVLGVYSGLPLPGLGESAWIATVLFYSLPCVILAAIVFVAPLRGMAARLSAAKASRLAAVATRIDATTEALHRLVDQEAVAERDADAARLSQTRIDALNKALSSLLQERDFVKKLSTWPWDPGTFRAVVSAFALPILLFLITRYLDRLI